MSKVICVMGESGSGKTTSMRTLDPTTTFYIDCDGKGLAWKGWRSQYNREHKNFKSTRNIQEIEGILHAIDQKCPSVKTVVIDTLNTCMLDHEIEQMKTSGYGKWIDLTQYSKKSKRITSASAFETGPKRYGWEQERTDAVDFEEI